MIIRPDKRYGKIFDVLIEFKFIKLKEVGMSADKAQKLSEDELIQLPEIANQLTDGESHRYMSMEKNLNKNIKI